MKTPRDLSGADLAKAIRVLGDGSHDRPDSNLGVTTLVGGEHHEVIPNHSPIKIGTLRGILRSVAAHHQITVAELIERLEL
jgi:hypothetical protein